MDFVLDDGGRAEAGYKGTTGDCFTRALAIAGQMPYQEVYDLVNDYGKNWERQSKKRSTKTSARTGIYRSTARKILADLSWQWTPTMHIGSGCRVHLREDELPSGRIIVALSKHFAAVVDGVVYDLYDPSRDGTRCVYGYWETPR